MDANRIDKKEIFTKYMDYVLTNNHQPSSVYAFSKENEIEEQDFYSHFSSFKSLEKEFFETLITNTLLVVESTKGYEEYDTKNKLLSFYFTFFANLTANRSFVLYVFNQNDSPLKKVALMSRLKVAFLKYLEKLDFESIDLQNDKANQFKNRLIYQSAWVQLVLTMDFWIKDTSKDFDKTDVFIEKSVHTSFDILNITPIKSVIDFGKFIYKEKMHSN